MSRSTPSTSTSPRASAQEALDEICLLAELRLAVEGARTAAEERLARALPEWSDRLNRICARYAMPSPA